MLYLHCRSGVVWWVDVYWWTEMEKAIEPRPWPLTHHLRDGACAGEPGTEVPPSRKWLSLSLYISLYIYFFRSTWSKVNQKCSFLEVSIYTIISMLFGKMVQLDHILTYLNDVNCSKMFKVNQKCSFLEVSIYTIISMLFGKMVHLEHILTKTGFVHLNTDNFV